MVIETVTDAPCPLEFTADTETGYVPDELGVPEMAPVAALSVKPGGRPLAR